MGDFSKRIKCAGCDRNLLELRFSENTKKKYRDSLAKNRRDPRIPINSPRCQDCSPGNREEMKCVMCDRVMDLDRFSKQQRKKADDAHCKDCLQDKLDREPDIEVEKTELGILADMTRDLQLGTSNSRYSSANSAVTRSRLAPSESDRLETETNPSSDWAAGNDAISFDGSAFSGSSSIYGRKNTGSAWDNFPQTSRPTIAGSTISRSTNNPGFVKQPAVGKSMEQKAAEQLERDRARKQQEDDEVELDRSDDSDDSDDGEYAY